MKAKGEPLLRVYCCDTTLGASFLHLAPKINVTVRSRNVTAKSKGRRQCIQREMVCREMCTLLARNRPKNVQHRSEYNLCGGWRKRAFLLKQRVDICHTCRASSVKRYSEQLLYRRFQRQIHTTKTEALNCEQSGCTSCEFISLVTTNRSSANNGQQILYVIFRTPLNLKISHNT